MVPAASASVGPPRPVGYTSPGRAPGPLSPAVESTLRRLTGLEIAGYQFDPHDVPAYQDVLQTGRAQFHPSGGPIIGQMMPAALRPLLPRIVHLLGDHPVVYAPLLVSGRTLGILNVTAHWLTPDDVTMVAALADHVAIALEHVAGRAEMRSALERERMRNLVAETLASTRDLSEVLHQVVGLAVEMTGADAGGGGPGDPGRPAGESSGASSSPGPPSSSTTIRPTRRRRRALWRPGCAPSSDCHCCSPRKTSGRWPFLALI